MARTPIRYVFILGALTAFGSMSIDMYLPSLPTLQRDLAADGGTVQLTLAAFFIGLALGQALFGPISDRFGRKRPLYAGIAVYVLASAGCALATSIEALIALRFLQALGACAGLVVARAMVRDLFDARDSARMFSMLMLVMGMAPILAPLLGGYLLTWFGWESIFWTLAVFGLCCGVAAARWLPETLRPRPAGAGLGIGSALAGYRRLLMDRHFVGYALSAGVAFGGLFAYITGSPFVFIDLYGVPPDAFGWLFGLNALGLIVATQINRWLLQSYDPNVILGRALRATAVLSVVLLATTLFEIGGFIGLLLPLFGFMASLGFTQPNAMAGALAEHGDQAGSASALLGTIQFGAASVAGVLVGVLNDGTALPMAGLIAACGVGSLMLHHRLVGTRPLDAGWAARSTGRRPG